MKPYNQHIILHDSVCGDGDPLLMHVYMFSYVHIQLQYSILRMAKPMHSSSLTFALQRLVSSASVTKLILL